MRRSTFLRLLAAAPAALTTAQASAAPAAPGELITAFPAGEATILWKRACGPGFAAPLAAADRVFLFHRQADDAVLECMENITGKFLWKAQWESGYRDDFGFDTGPRAAPVLSGGSVYCYGAEGRITAVNAADGKQLWQVDAAAKLGSPKGFFGRSGSPLVHGDLVLAAIGGPDAGIVGLDRKTGAVRWQSLTGEAGYASPLLMKSGGSDYAVFFTRAGVAVLEPATGKICAQEPFRSRMEASVNAASPVAVGPDHFFTTSSYGTGAALWKLEPGGKLSSAWKKQDCMDAHYSTPVLMDGFLYGFHGRQETGQELRCLKAGDGIVQWSTPIAPGHIILQGKQALMVTEDGELLLTPLSPDKKPDLNTRAQILRGGHRAPPALLSGLLYARDASRMVCVDLRKLP